MNTITAWPFKEAEKILKRINHKTPDKGYVLFETGYGPSGLPHIGTFGEVTRTVMVMNAMKILAPEIPTRLFVYSDDMDGLRKVPDNIPNPEMVRENIGKPLTSIPDPFGEYESYAHYMNNKLKTFLNHFGFHYEFQSATEHYKSGKYNDMMHKVLVNCEKILEVMKPSLKEERSATYNPLLPISPTTGKFIFNGVTEWNSVENTISFVDEDSTIRTISVFNGNCKLQWKADWAMRWAALGVDYEMHGKDLTPTAELSSKICKILGGKPPVLYIYEMFTDENGQKISKSKGNGVSVDDWLEFGTLESIALFMYEHPERAKKLYLATIPRYVDEYLKLSKKLCSATDLVEKYNNPAFHIPLEKRIVSENFKIDFNLISNLASVCNPENKEILIEYAKKYQKDLTPDEAIIVSELCEKALNFHNRFVKPNNIFATLTEEDCSKLIKLHDLLETFCSDDLPHSDDEMQNQIFTIAREIGYEKNQMKDWFQFIYKNLFGQNHGPRLGSFINIYGWKNFLKLIKNRC